MSRFVEIPDIYDNPLAGERRIRTILGDQKSRYFDDGEELFKYAERETEDIGYVDREKTWVRLPEKFLVLGEEHDKTTLMDLVEATGIEKYIYEGGQGRPSPYLHPGQKTAEGTGRHALEEISPKFVIGLIGVEHELQARLAALVRHPLWKSNIRHRQGTVALADPEERQRLYKAKLAEWSADWETEHQGAEARGHWKAREFEKLPIKPYTRLGAEVASTRKGLEQLREAATRGEWALPGTAARGKAHPITLFYAETRRSSTTRSRSSPSACPSSSRKCSSRWPPASSTSVA
jgi:hypothetical protein